jgi:DNA polymerase-3 subunit alpha
VTRKLLSGRENEMVIETEPGLFEISFLDGIELMNVKLRITTYAELDRFPRTIKESWHPLDEATLRLFSRGATDGAIFFESDKMREWLFDFDPESMSDLVLLNAIYWPGRIQLFDKLLERKRNPDRIKTYENAAINLAVRDTYGLPVYQEQYLLLTEQIGEPEIPLTYELAPKGHFIGRTMMAVEALWSWRNSFKLK